MLCLLYLTLGIKCFVQNHFNCASYKMEGKGEGDDVQPWSLHFIHKRLYTVLGRSGDDFLFRSIEIFALFIIFFVAITGGVAERCKYTYMYNPYMAHFLSNQQQQQKVLHTTRIHYTLYLVYLIPHLIYLISIQQVVICTYASDTMQKCKKNDVAAAAAANFSLRGRPGLSLFCL